MSTPNPTVVDFGVSGYVNTPVELKSSDSGTKYVSILLGRGKDSRGKEQMSDSIILFNKDAELFAAQVAKGDLIRFTKVALMRNPVEGKSYAYDAKLVGKDFVKISEQKTDDDKRSIVDFGVSGYVNTDVELKISDKGKKYVSLLLGRGKDSRGKDQLSDSVVLFDKDAELFAELVSKGALIRFTKVALQRLAADGKTYSGAVKIIGKDFELIGRESNGQSQRPVQQARSQQAAPQAAPQPQPDFDSFDDDIPF